MANGKSNAEIINWYNVHIRIFQQREKAFLQSLKPEAEKTFRELLSLTSEDKQNKQLEQDIIAIENALSFEMFENKTDYKKIQQDYANRILNINKRLDVMGDTSGLQNLAEGNFNNILSEAKGELRLVTDDEINKWLNKMFRTIEEISKENKDPNVTSRGIVSNLKGAYLEMAVMAELSRLIPKSIEADGTYTANIELFNTGNVSAKIGTNVKGNLVNRQLPQDIILTYSDEGKQTLQQALEEGKTSKKGRTTISVPMYEAITEKTAGISVKAGTSPFKLVEGSLANFFENGDDDTDAYRLNVKMRYEGSGLKDNDKGRSVNKFLVAMHLPEAFGSGNMFFATRNNLLTSLSKKVEDIRDNNQLYMTYEVNKSLFYGRILDK